MPGLAEDVKCATYAVWEDRASKRGRRIGLNVVILPALGAHPAPDPIFVFGGGPGEGITTAVGWIAELKDLRQRRDIVLVDQRGTGRSNPLDCQLYGEPMDLHRVAGDLFPIEEVRKCRDQLERIADLRLYTTDLAVDDVDEVRGWLGYERINLRGGSYGTRAAQVYLRRHPASVRSAVLIAVAPADEPLPLHHAYAGQRAFDLVTSECAAQEACHAAFPHPEDDLRAVGERVAGGVKVTVTDSRSKEKVEVEPAPGLVVEGIRLLMYGKGGRNLPLQIHLAAHGDLAPLVQMAIDNRLELDDALALGLLFSVTCAEDLPFIDDVTAERETRGTFLGDYRIRQQKAVCALWPRAAVPADVHELVHSNVPVLLISGERDPVTPPEFGARAATYLANSLHVVVPRGSHGGAGECTDTLIRDFVERGSIQGLDTSCVAKTSPTAFATSQ